MNAFIRNTDTHLRLLDFGTEFFGEEEVAQAELRLLDALETMPKGGLLVIDFEGTRIASEAARKLLKRPLLRLGTGEFEDRFIVLDHVNPSRYSVDAMLRREGLSAVERTSAGPRIIGKQDPVAVATFDFVAAGDQVTAKEVLDHFQLQNIASATNRLTSLAKIGLIRRTGPRPLPTGGREYVFTAVS